MFHKPLVSLSCGPRLIYCQSASQHTFICIHCLQKCALNRMCIFSNEAAAAAAWWWRLWCVLIKSKETIMYYSLVSNLSFWKAYTIFHLQLSFLQKFTNEGTQLLTVQWKKKSPPPPTHTPTGCCLALSYVCTEAGSRDRMSLRRSPPLTWNNGNVAEPVGSTVLHR